jgi:hypothetical protein
MGMPKVKKPFTQRFESELPPPTVWRGRPAFRVREARLDGHDPHPDLVWGVGFRVWVWAQPAPRAATRGWKRAHYKTPFGALRAGGWDRTSLKGEVTWDIQGGGHVGLL